MNKKETFFVEITYSDESTMNFDVTIEGSDKKKLATLMMVTRGTLMASMGTMATAYNDQGFDVCSYMK